MEKQLAIGMWVAAFLLVVTANVAPWLMGRLCHSRFAYPLDCNLHWADGTRVLGNHKTWRGVIAALLGCCIAGQFIGIGFLVGTEFGALAMLGDALSSAIKRRMRLAPGSEVFGIDQLPEAILPLSVFAPSLHLSWIGVVVVTIGFMTLDMMSERFRRNTQ
jgi:hypothetical protein